MPKLDFFQCLESTLEPVFDATAYSQIPQEMLSILNTNKLLKDTYITEIGCDKCGDDCPEHNILTIKHDQHCNKYYYTCPTGYLKNPVWLTDEVIKGGQFDFNRFAELICAKSNLKSSGNILCGIPDFGEIACDEINGKTISVSYFYNLNKSDNIVLNINVWRLQVNTKIVVVIVPDSDVLRKQEVPLLEHEQVYLITLKTVLENDFDVRRILSKRITKTEQLIEKAVVSSSPPTSAKWEDFSIQVIDHHTIKATDKRYNFAELGFKDKRTGLPDKQWQTLLDIAHNHGSIRWGESGSREGLKIIISRLSKRLKAIFKIPGNPFYPYKQFKCYKAKFKIEDISYGQTDPSG